MSIAKDRKVTSYQESSMSLVVLFMKLRFFHYAFLISSNFIKTTNDISLDSWIYFLPFGFSPVTL